jgi:hypothetical protein
VNRDIQISLHRAVEQLPHPSFQQVADCPVEPMEDHDWITQQNAQAKSKTWKWGMTWRTLAAACACFAFMFFGSFQWFSQNYMIDSTIDFDVNPSIEVTTNKKDMVLKVRGLNEEGRAVLEGHNFEGKSLEEATRELFGAMVDSSYLHAAQNTVLLSVISKDEAHAKRLESDLNLWVKQALSQSNGEARLVGQTILPSGDVSRQAESLGISRGKLILIESLMQQIPGLTLEAMIPLSIEELLDLAKNEGADLSGKFTLDDDDDDSSIPDDLGDDDDGSIPDDLGDDDDGSIPDDLGDDDDSSIPDDLGDDDDGGIPDDLDDDDDSSIPDDLDDDDLSKTKDIVFMGRSNLLHVSV